MHYEALRRLVRSYEREHYLGHRYVLTTRQPLPAVVERSVAEWTTTSGRAKEVLDHRGKRPYTRGSFRDDT